MHIHTKYFLLHSPGVLAGIWPCGVVVLLREIYIAESKAQVYGHLHEFLKDHPDTAQSLSKSSPSDVQIYHLHVYSVVQVYLLVTFMYVQRIYTCHLYVYTCTSCVTFHFCP